MVVLHVSAPVLKISEIRFALVERSCKRGRYLAGVVSSSFTVSSKRLPGGKKHKPGARCINNQAASDTGNLSVVWPYVHTLGSDLRSIS